ncbi:hypothetical protein [Desmospora profundinema]|uniref:Cell division protein FtsL n=1 Tax=Desmospora profundinema TaxID=1571184 RepID=A0ABU1ITJ8_9BACL|nr:hypothetical protein [Desmospora profundinema]MDR6227514.1 cell division protein FtsL [Desmospora profundinema]
MSKWVKVLIGVVAVVVLVMAFFYIAAVFGIVTDSTEIIKGT